MAKQAVLVRYKLKPGKLEEFLPILRDHIAKTRATEPGCVQFDVLLPHEGTDCIHLYEVYADEEAFRAHNESPQLASYRESSSPLLDERVITWCTVTE